VAVKVLQQIARKFNHAFAFEEGLVGAIAIDETGNPFPEATLQLCQSADAILFGAIGHPKYDNDPSAPVRPEQGLLAMRKALGLFANIRPVTSYPILADASPLKPEIIAGVDFVVFRELTGGSYFGEKGRSEDRQSAFDTCSYNREEILRVTKLAFEAAGKRRKKVTLVDKANVMETSRLWREVVQEYAGNFPEITLDLMFVDNAAMALIQNPRQFDVILTENMFGDILTDEASVITGSLGMLPSASVGNQVALFEPIHGSYPQAAGQDIANPMAAVLSAAMLLETSFGLWEEGKAIRQAVEACLTAGFATTDNHPREFLGTTEIGDKIISFI
jgi:3-isopropylmalate dehydrogenase